MLDDTGHNREDQLSPVETAIFLAVLISGFLLVHFCVAPIW